LKDAKEFLNGTAKVNGSLDRIWRQLRWLTFPGQGFELDYTSDYFDGEEFI